MEAGANCDYAELSIKVIRADGTVEDLGVVAKYDKNDLNKENTLWHSEQEQS